MNIAVSGDRRIEEILEINIMEWIKRGDYAIAGFSDIEDLVKKSKFDRQDLIFIASKEPNEVRKLKFIFPFSYIILVINDIKKPEKEEMLRAGCYDIIEKEKTKNFEEVLREITANISNKIEKIIEMQVAQNGRVKNRD